MHMHQKNALTNEKMICGSYKITNVQRTLKWFISCVRFAAITGGCNRPENITQEIIPEFTKNSAIIFPFKSGTKEAEEKQRLSIEVIMCVRIILDSFSLADNLGSGQSLTQQ